MDRATLMDLLPALVVALPLLGGVLALPLRRLGERPRIVILGMLCLATVAGDDDLATAGGRALCPVGLMAVGAALGTGKLHGQRPV